VRFIGWTFDLRPRRPEEYHSIRFGLFRDQPAPPCPDNRAAWQVPPQEREEIAIISTYLPKQMSDGEVNAAIAEAVRRPATPA
jgi:hypothetical protein